MLQKNYFKGWYFKCINDDHTIAFIPAFHRSNQEVTASLQIITNSSAFNIYFDSLKFQHHRLEMYTDRSEDGSLIPLEAMGTEMAGDEE